MDTLLRLVREQPRYLLVLCGGLAGVYALVRRYRAWRLAALYRLWARRYKQKAQQRINDLEERLQRDKVRRKRAVGEHFVYFFVYE